SSRSEAALEAGEFDVFLGKMHHHMLLPGWLSTFHPDVEQLRSDIAGVLASTPFGRLVALEVKRRNKGFYEFPGPRIEYAEFAASSPSVHNLPIHELSVALDAAGDVTLNARDGRE